MDREGIYALVTKFRLERKAKNTSQMEWNNRLIKQNFHLSFRKSLADTAAVIRKTKSRVDYPPLREVTGEIRKCNFIK